MGGGEGGGVAGSTERVHNGVSVRKVEGALRGGMAAAIVGAQAAAWEVWVCFGGGGRTQQPQHSKARAARAAAALQQEHLLTEQTPGAALSSSGETEEEAEPFYMVAELQPSSGRVQQLTGGCAQGLQQQHKTAARTSAAMEAAGVVAPCPASKGHVTWRGPAIAGSRGLQLTHLGSR